ncbi:MAG: glycine cleavage system protein GcvH [Atopobiaceae bacterium]|jgi:glycine cleavage system H protein|nr:glycine cleavage system protein GcvH [Atopobiaceae bacterium]
MSVIPAELSYTTTHEWVSIEGDTYTIGLTDYAQNALGDLVFVNLPQEGDEVVNGEAFADVESVKAVSDVYSPVTGTVVQVNEELLDAPEAINEDPYNAWLVRVEEVSEVGDLLDADAYEAHCEQEA